ncbi:MAG: PorV/PorQ family protein [Elusimicrobiota bacterium]
MRRATLGGILATAALLAGAAGRCAENPGTTAAPILQVPLGARAVGMGGAFTGLADDGSALYYNPAGLSTLDSREFSVMYLKGWEDETVEHIQGVTPIPWGFIGDYASLGASGLFSQHGDIEVNRTNADGSFLRTENIDAGGDVVATLGYSERVMNFEVRSWDREMYRVDHFLGISGKYIRSTLAQTYSAATVAGDVGYLVRIPDAGIGLGFSLLNVGPGMRFISEKDPLPVTARSGFSYSPRLTDSSLPGSQSLIFSADGEYLPQERMWHASLGGEYMMWRTFSTRLGYQINRDLMGLTFGFGVRWRGIHIDYAWALSETMNDIHRFGLTYRFGRVPLRRREERRRPYIESMPEREDLQDIEERVPRSFDKPEEPRRNPPDREKTVAPGWIY